MSDRSKTNHNRQMRLLNKLKNLYLAAECFTWTQDKLLDNISKDIYDSDDWKKGPSYIHEYIRGFQDALREHLMSDKVEHCYFFAGSWRNHEDIQRHLTNTAQGWQTVSNCIGGFFWNRKPSWAAGRRPYFLMKEHWEKICDKCFLPRDICPCEQIAAGRAEP